MNKKLHLTAILFSAIIILLLVFISKLFIGSSPPLIPQNTLLQNINPKKGWITNGPVYTILSARKGITYIGGDFNYIGPYTGSGVPIKIANNQLQSNFPKIDGSVKVAIPDNKNGWYIGGTFSKVGDLTRYNIAHILPNGAVDENWNPRAIEVFPDEYINYPPTKGEIYSLALSRDGSTLYVGGNFNKIGVQKRSGIAALDTKTGLATDWDPVADNPIYVLTLSRDGKILYVGGRFNNIGGHKRNGLAALDTSTGLATKWNPDANPFDPFQSERIHTLALSPDGSILYVGGYFYTIGGQKRNNIAALDTSTGLATEWNPEAAPVAGGFNWGEVYALSLNSDGSILYVGGNFNEIGGQRRIGLAALDTKTGLATEWNSNVGTNFNVATFTDSNLGTVYSLALSPDDSILYVGGNFNNISGQPNPLYEFDNINSFSCCNNPDSSTIDGQIKNNFATIDTKTGQPLRVISNASDVVLTLSLNPDGSILYVGGAFDSIGGEVRNHIAALDSLTGQPTKWNPDAYGNFLPIPGIRVVDVILSLALSPDGSILYVGGNFNKIGGQERNNIAALDTSTGLATEWNPDVNNPYDPSYDTLRALALSHDGSILYVGGNFNNIGGQKRNYIAALDTKTGLATKWNPDIQMNPSFPVEDMMVYWFGVNDLTLSSDGSILYVGGQFTSSGGQKRNGLAALETKSGITTSWNPEPDAGWGIKSLALSPDDSILYVGGNFNNIGGQRRIGLAALDTKTGLATDWDPDVRDEKGNGGSVDKLFLSLDGSILYIRGEFDKVANQERKNIAVIDTTTGQPLSLSSKDWFFDLLRCNDYPCKE